MIRIGLECHLRQGLKQVARTDSVAVLRAARRRPWEPPQARCSRPLNGRTTAESPSAAPMNPSSLGMRLVIVVLFKKQRIFECNRDNLTRVRINLMTKRTL